MNPNAPIVVGLAGQAGSGKTVTAQSLAPTAQVMTNNCRCNHDTSSHNNTEDDTSCNEEECTCSSINYEGSIYWTHLFFALPIYRIVTARQKIIGDNSRNRILYEIHEAIVDLFGRSPIYSAIKNYDDLIELVRYVATIPCEPAGEKARTFMQEFGSLCREYDENVFVNWMNRKIQEEYREFSKEYSSDRYPGLKLGIVLSDIRFANEVKSVVDNPNGILYKFTASPEVIQDRLLDRDGKVLSATQSNHESENGLTLVKDEDFDEIIDTSNFTVSDQANYIKNLVSKKFNVYV